MNIHELKKELTKNNINKKMCLINPVLCPEGALCLINNDNNSWDVILNDRGDYLINERFILEDDACKFFLKNALIELTFRNDFNPKDIQKLLKESKDLLKKYGY